MVLFFWLLWGDFAWSMKERSIPSVLQLLLKKHGASDMLTGILVGSLPGILGMILGPVVSYCSDRHRGRWGRRIPYLLAATPVAFFAMIGLAFAPATGDWLHRWSGMGLNAGVLVSFAVFWTVFEFSTIVSNAVFGGLINDVVPSKVLGRFYGAFRALSLAAAILFNYSIMGVAETHFFAIFVGLAALYGFGFTAMCLKVKEGEYPPPPVEQPGLAGSFQNAVRSYFRDCFGHSYYRWFFAAMAFSWMASIPPVLFGVYYAKSISLSMDDYGKCLALTYLISLLLAWPLGALADRIHPLRLGLAAQSLFLLVTLWGGFFAHDGGTFRVVMVAQGVLVGAWMTATASLNQRLLPREKFAQFASASALVTSLGTIMVGPLLGVWLDLTHHVYRHVFLGSFLLMALSVAAGLVVHRRFMALGGPENYAAPNC